MISSISSKLIALSLMAAPAISPSIEGQPRTSSTVPSKSSSLRKMNYVLQSAPRLLPIGKPVGELQEKWTYPSDHIAIGMTWDGLHIGSWNVLNNAYISWVIEKNSQGLSRSQIAKENIEVNESGLTIRDQSVVASILEMLTHPTHPRSLLSLQECGPAFLDELEKNLPPSFKIVRDTNSQLKDYNAMIYDTRALRFIEEESNCAVSGVFSEDSRTIMDIVFERIDTNQRFNVLNGHLPGAPGNPAPDEFARFAAAKKAVIAMGDMNFNELEMGDAFDRAGNFQKISPYCTNINPFDFVSKAIDHFFVSIPGAKEISANKPEEVQANLQYMIDLLQ